MHDHLSFLLESRYRVPIPHQALSRLEIRRAATCYLEGWHDADADRLGRACHSQMALRDLVCHSDGGTQMSQMSTQQLVQAARIESTARRPWDPLHKDIQILDIEGTIASVKVLTQERVEYLHLAYQDGSWSIVDVLRKPQTEIREYKLFG